MLAMLNTIDKPIRDQLSSYFKDRVKYEEPMARHTYIKVGGPAEAFVTPAAEAELVTAIRLAHENRLPYTVIGGGTNLLVKDGGIRGMVISTGDCLTGITQSWETGDDVLIAAMAGTPLAAVCRYAVGEALAGMNFALGIPGTLGGAIKMNAGTHLGQIASALSRLTILQSDGQMREFSANDVTFGYRSLSFPANLTAAEKQWPPIIRSGTFLLKKTDGIRLKAERDSILKERRAKQPLDQPSAGCFFKNPDAVESAGMLIDLAGLKGTSVGDARISEKHGNFFINAGNASADDFLSLMDKAQNLVAAKFGIKLEPEVQIVGS